MCIRRTLSRRRRARSKSDHFYSLIAGSGGVAGSVEGGPLRDAYGSKAHAVSEEIRDGLFAGGNPIVEVEKRLLVEENRKNTQDQGQKHREAGWSYKGFPRLGSWVP